MTLPLRAGRTPNLYWNAVSTDRLRKDPQYTALPPIGDLTLDGPDSYRSDFSSHTSRSSFCCHVQQVAKEGGYL